MSMQRLLAFKNSTTKLPYFPTLILFLFEIGAMSYIENFLALSWLEERKVIWENVKRLKVDT